MRYITAIGLMLLTTGCGIMAIEKAKKEYDASRAAFKECLARRPPGQCEGHRQAMNADARAYASIKGNTVGIEFNQ